MPTTTNFGWTTPADTDLVKDGASAIRTLGNGIDTSFLDLKGGTTGQVLSKNTNTDLDFTWVTPNDADAIQNTIVDAKGDLITATAADTPARLASSGVNGDFLTVDTTTATGLKWAAGPSVPLTTKGDLLTYSTANARLGVGSNGLTLLADSGQTTGLRWGRVAQIGCSLYKTADQSCGDNTTTVVTWDAENFDTDAFHDNTTNNSRITIPTGLGGKYLFTCTQTWLASASGMRELGLRKNGSTFLMYVFISPNSLEAASGTLSIVVSAAAGDYFEITGRQRTGGGNLSIDGGAANTSEFGCTFLGA